MTALILEDNLAYSLDYEIILEKLNHKVLGIHKNTRSALNSLNKAIPDYMIVDIFLDGNEKSFPFVEEVKKYRIPFIVCTAYPEKEFMDIAMDLGAEAFFTKPLDKAALTFEIRRIAKNIENSRSKGKSIIVKFRRKLIRVPHEDILKVETKGNYSYVYVADDKRYIIKLSLKKTAEQLDPAIFHQANRSTIVNMSLVDQVDTYNRKVIMHNTSEVILGRTFKDSFMKEFMERGDNKII